MTNIENPLKRQPIFIVVNFIILLSSITLSLFIIIAGNYSISMTASGYNTFLEIFKFPLTVLAILIPFNAFYISFVRSEQSRMQIQLLSSTNNFANHYKHIEEFEKHLERNSVSSKQFNITYLHNMLFPQSSFGVILN